MLWIIFTGMVTIALFIIFLPLLRPKGNDLKSADHFTLFYQGQLKELENEITQRMISEDDAQISRAEIAQNLRAASGSESKEPKKISKFYIKFITAVIGFTIPILSFGLYAMIGSPNLPSQESSTPQEISKGNTGTLESASVALVSQLASRLQQNPNNFENWRLYARSLVLLRRFTDAIAAYNQAIPLSPKGINLLSELAEAQINAADGVVNSNALKTLERSLLINPKEPRTRYYVGLAAKQAGRLKHALEIWLNLQRDSTPDAPWSKTLSEQISRLSKTMGISAETLATMRKKIESQTQK